MISYEEFIRLTEGIYWKIKKDFYKKTKDLLFASKIELPESIIVSRACEYDEDLPGVVVLGRFETTPCPMITIFYGSFEKEFFYSSRKMIEEKLFETITHEVIHYYETQLGTKELFKVDLELKKALLDNLPGGK
jgi:hypothetical protein